MGILVTVAKDRVQVPHGCAGCGGEADSRSLAWTPKLEPRYGVLSIPICSRCKDATSIWGKWWQLPAVLGGVWVGACVLTSLWSGITPEVALAFGVILGIAGAGGIFGWAHARRSLAAWPPVEVRKRGKQEFDIYCRNSDWGVDLAEKSGGRCSNGERSVRWLPSIALGALILVCMPVATCTGFLSAHEDIYLDDASGEPLQFWIDGEPDVILEGFAEDGGWVLTFAPAGPHEFGWSAPGADGPEASMVIQVPEGAILFNPRANACYANQGFNYTRDTTVEQAAANGSYEIIELADYYWLPHTDIWFEDPPEKVQIPSGEKSSWRNVVSRDPACTTLVQAGCDHAVIYEFIACHNAAESLEARADCEAGAQRQCGIEESSSP